MDGGAEAIDDVMEVENAAAAEAAAEFDFSVGVGVGNEKMISGA